MEQQEQLPVLRQLAHKRITLVLAGLQANFDGIGARIAWRLVDVGDRWRAAIAGPPRTPFRESWLLRRPAEAEADLGFVPADVSSP